MTVAESIRLVQLRITPTAKEEALAQAKELVGAVMGIQPAALMLHHGMALTHDQLVELGAFTERRASGEPLQYILGEWSFMNLPFIVEPGVLIPRADTEVLCEEALRLSVVNGYRTALDLCCGSGCIGVALSKLGHLLVTGADISRDCIRLTEENAALNETELDVRLGDLFGAVIGEQFDLIVCNPPYLSQSDMESLQPEVTFEPKLALYGGGDGLDFYRRIAREYRMHLNPGGTLIMEIGSTQAKAVEALFPGAKVTKDYCGNPRIVAVVSEDPV